MRVPLARLQPLAQVSPIFALELLNRFAQVFKDYCGVLSEEALRKNYVLVYEILDEVVDYGHVMDSSTEHLRYCVHHAPRASFGMAEAEPASIADIVKGHKTARGESKLTSFKRLISNTLNHNSHLSRGLAPSTAAAKSVLASGPSSGAALRNEIFVDLFERLTALFTREGEIVRSEIDGRLVMRSFLLGNPQMTLSLTEDLVVGRRADAVGVVVDDIAFHEAASLEHFEDARVLILTPPDGEFTLMTYRMTGDFRIPFRVFAFVDDEQGDGRFVINVKIRADLPLNTFGKSVRVQVPLPRATQSCSFELPLGVTGQTTKWTRGTAGAQGHVDWLVPKFPGGSESQLFIRVALDATHTPSWRNEVGPVSLQFEVPQHTFSGMALRSLKIADQHAPVPAQRWVRYVAQSESYVCRL